MGKSHSRHSTRSSCLQWVHAMANQTYLGYFVSHASIFIYNSFSYERLITLDWKPSRRPIDPTIDSFYSLLLMFCLVSSLSLPFTLFSFHCTFISLYDCHSILIVFLFVVVVVVVAVGLLAHNLNFSNAAAFATSFPLLTTSLGSTSPSDLPCVGGSCLAATASPRVHCICFWFWFSLSIGKTASTASADCQLRRRLRRRWQLLLSKQTTLRFGESVWISFGDSNDVDYVADRQVQTCRRRAPSIAQAGQAVVRVAWRLSSYQTNPVEQIKCLHLGPCRPWPN